MVHLPLDKFAESFPTELVKQFSEEGILDEFASVGAVRIMARSIARLAHSDDDQKLYTDLVPQLMLVLSPEMHLHVLAAAARTMPDSEKSYAAVVDAFEERCLEIVFAMLGSGQLEEMFQEPSVSRDINLFRESVLKRLNVNPSDLSAAPFIDVALPRTLAHYLVARFAHSTHADKDLFRKSLLFSNVVFPPAAVGGSSRIPLDVLDTAISEDLTGLFEVCRVFDESYFTSISAMLEEGHHDLFRDIFVELRDDSKKAMRNALESAPKSEL